VKKGRGSVRVQLSADRFIPEKASEYKWITSDYSPWVKADTVNAVNINKYDYYDGEYFDNDFEFKLNEKGEYILKVPYKDYDKSDLKTISRAVIKVSLKDESDKTITKEEKIMIPSEVPIIYGKLSKAIGNKNGKNILSLFTGRNDEVGVQTSGEVKFIKVGNNAEAETVMKMAFDTDKKGYGSVAFMLNQSGKYFIEISSDNSLPVKVPYIVIGDDATPLTDEGLKIIPTTHIVEDELELTFVTKAKSGFCYYQDYQLGRFKAVRIKNYYARVSLDLADFEEPHGIVRAFTIANGKFYKDEIEFYKPPESIELQALAKLDKEAYSPKEKATVKIKISDETGKPVKGNVVVAIYDRALENVDHARAQQSLSKLWSYKKPNYYRIGKSTLRQSYKPYSLDSMYQFEEIFSKYRLVDTRKLILSSGFYHDKFSGEGYGYGYGGAGGTLFDIGGADPFAVGGAAGELPQIQNAKPIVSLRDDFKALLSWHPDLVTDENGEVEVPIAFADNLTEWRIAVWAIDDRSRFGHVMTQVTVTQDLISRPVLPRYLIDKDEARLSSITHNYTDLPEVTASMKLLSDHLTTESKLSRSVSVENGGESLQHWQVKASAPGKITLQFPSEIKGFTDTPQKDLEIYPYGIERRDSASFDLSAQKSKSYEINTLKLPNEIAKGQNSLSVTYSPSIQGALYESIPFLFNYEHGCAEQTTNRFVSAALAHQLLKSRSSEQEAVTSFLAEGIMADPIPIPSTKDITNKLKASITKLKSMQNYNGGWAWFGRDDVNDEITNIVLYGLLRVKESGFEQYCDAQSKTTLRSCLRKGVRYLQMELRDIKDVDAIEVDGIYTSSLLNITKYRSLEGDAPSKQESELFDHLYTNRSKLSLKELSQLSLTAKINDKDVQWSQLLNDIQDLYKKANDVSIEAQAWILKVYLAHDPNSLECQKLARHLLSIRTNGSHWKSTIDTAACIDALSGLAAIQKDKFDGQDLSISLNEKIIVTLSGKQLQRSNNPVRITIANDHLSKGKLALKFSSEGELAGFGSAALSYFWQPEKFIPKEAQLRVTREYFLEKRTKNKEWNESDPFLQEYNYEYLPLESGDAVKVGDIVSVKVTIINPDAVKYLHIIDPKPAGLVTIDKLAQYIGEHSEYYRDPQLTSSNLYTDCSNEKDHSASYRLRAETVGTFTALPAQISAMYDPDINNHSESFVIRVED